MAVMGWAGAGGASGAVKVWPGGTADAVVVVAVAVEELPVAAFALVVAVAAVEPTAVAASVDVVAVEAEAAAVVAVPARAMLLAVLVAPVHFLFALLHFLERQPASL